MIFKNTLLIIINSKNINFDIKLILEIRIYIKIKKN